MATERDTIVRVLTERDGPVCFYCGVEFCDTETPTIEHFIAVSLGGTSHFDNLVLAHDGCNRRAGNLPVLEKIKYRDRCRDELQKRREKLANRIQSQPKRNWPPISETGNAEGG